MKSHDTEIEILNSRLASLQKEHLVAESHTSKLKEVGTYYVRSQSSETLSGLAYNLCCVITTVFLCVTSSPPVLINCVACAHVRPR